MSKEFEENLIKFRNRMAEKLNREVEVHRWGRPDSSHIHLQWPADEDGSYHVLDVREDTSWGGIVEILLPVNRFTIQGLRKNKNWLDEIEMYCRWLEEVQGGGFVSYIKSLLALKEESLASNQAIADAINDWLAEQLREYVKGGESERVWLANPLSQLSQDEGYQIYGNVYLSDATTTMRVLKIPPKETNEYIWLGIENVKQGYPVFLPNTPVDADRIRNRLREWKQRLA
jgi:hypothetical protein